MTNKPPRVKVLVELTPEALPEFYAAFRALRDRHGEGLTWRVVDG